MAADKSPMGRPPVQIDEELVERLAGIGCTDEEIAAVLGIAYSTLKLKKAKRPTLRERIDRGRVEAQRRGKSALYQRRRRAALHW